MGDYSATLTAQKLRRRSSLFKHNILILLYDLLYTAAEGHFRKGHFWVTKHVSQVVLRSFWLSSNLAGRHSILGEVGELPPCGRPHQPFLSLPFTSGIQGSEKLHLAGR